MTVDIEAAAVRLRFVVAGVDAENVDPSGIWTDNDLRSLRIPLIDLTACEV